MRFIIAVVFSMASVYALPQSNESEVDFRDERSVSTYIKNTIAEASQSIKEAGFDPFYIQREERNYSLPVPVIFNSGFLIEELFSNGLSNISLKSASYNLITSRLNFAIEMPLIDFGAGAASAEATVFGNTCKMNGSGKVEIQRMRFAGFIRFNITLTDRIRVTVRSTEVKFSMEGINSDVQLVIQDKDYSDKMNEFLNKTVPDTFIEYRSEIDELLGILLMNVADRYLLAHQR